MALAGVEVLRTRPRSKPAPPLATPPDADDIVVADEPPPILSHPAPQSPPILLPPPPRMVQRHAQILDVFQVLARVLAVRFLLLLALIGAFVLALEAMQRQTMPGLEVLIAYSLLAIGPLVLLEIRGKPIVRSG